MRFAKYHALGNDYLVLNPRDYPDWDQPTPDQIRAICHRQYGLGSDGILWGPLPSDQAVCGLRIFNPDGSEAEKSGNGLRIFSRYLWDQQLVDQPKFTVETPGGIVSSQLDLTSLNVKVGMGSVSFLSTTIPVSGPEREVINETIEITEQTFTFCAATIGNPHCVIPLDSISPELARRYGPELEAHPIFPHKTNVQFMEVIDRRNVRIEIWERGAGYTLASGSSSSAAAAVAHKLGRVDDCLTVHMPGGSLAIEIDEGYRITISGSVNHVADGQMHSEIFQPKR